MSRCYHNNRSRISFPIWVSLPFLCAFVVAVLGWIFNIKNIVEKGPLLLDGETIAQIIGIFVVPLGCVLGWIL